MTVRWILILLASILKLSLGIWNAPFGRPDEIPIGLEVGPGLPVYPPKPPMMYQRNKFYLRPIEKTPTLVHGGTLLGELEPGLGPAGGRKKCCRNEWAVDDQEMHHLQVPSVSHLHHEYYHNLEEIKPVTERIEGDLHYDFRTKTHYVR